MQIWAEPRKSALPICNYSQILYQFLTFTQNLKRSRIIFLNVLYTRELIINNKGLKTLTFNNQVLLCFLLSQKTMDIHSDQHFVQKMHFLHALLCHI